MNPETPESREPTEPDEQELKALDEALRRIGRDLDRALEGESSRCGKYTLLSEIGQGGYGEVHLAVQDAPAERRVAIKILKRGLDTREILSRFTLEQRALARIDHPNVATILDAGTTADGRPWFAMPLLDGDPITVACDDARLGLEDRVSILAAACNGVQAAHAQGIVHRDLKPGNLIVVREGDGRLVPKVIDFGIAKALDADESATRTVELGRLGTPAYMAPEQLRLAGPWADTRSDVFALGTILRELLSGVRTPDPRSTARPLAAQASRCVADEALVDPDRMQAAALARGYATPAALARRLRGDLDAVVAKATASDPDERYQSVDALSADLRRWLAHDPISARPPTAAVVAAAFARKHRAVVAASAVAIALVACAATFALVQSRRAHDESLRATIAARRASEVGAALRDVLSGIDAAAVDGKDRTLLADLLDAATARHERTRAGLDPIAAADIATVLGDAYNSVDLPERALALADAAVAALPPIGDPRKPVGTADAVIARARLEALRGEAIARRSRARDGFVVMRGMDAAAFDAWGTALRLFDGAGASADRAAIRCRIRFWSEDRAASIGGNPSELLAELAKSAETLDDRDQLKWTFRIRRAEMNTWVNILRDYPREVALAGKALGLRHPLVLAARTRMLGFSLMASVESIATRRDDIPSYTEAQLRDAWRRIVEDSAPLVTDIRTTLGPDHRLEFKARLWAASALGYLEGAEAARPAFDALRADIGRAEGPASSAALQLETAWQCAVRGPKSGRWW